MGSKGKLVFLLILVIQFSFIYVSGWDVDINKKGTVDYVIDGDTFVLTDGTHVRLGDVSAPEPDQTGGPQATSTLENLIDGKKVFLDTDPVLNYGRLVAVVYVKHSSTHYKNINWVLLQKNHFNEDDHDNEFDPSEWTKYEQYADSPTPTPTPTPPDPTPSPSPNNYDLIIIVRGLGSINHTIGLTTYKEDTTITITATPEENWRLQYWQKNGQNVGTSDSITFTMSYDIELIVSFKDISPDCGITFNILNEYNDPIEQVNILSLKFPEFQENITLVTRSEDSIQSDPLYHGDYLFKIFKQGYLTNRSEISLQNGEKKIHNVHLMWKKVDVSVTIVDTNEKPVKNIQVKSIQQPENQQVIHGYTNENGVAVFEEVLPGNYLFEIVDEYVETEHIEVKTTLDSSSYSLSEEVQLLCTLQGRVEDDKGSPLEDVRVYIVQQSDGNENLNFTCDGEYTIRGIYPGSYSILYRKDGYQNISSSINLATSGPHQLTTVALIPIPPNFTPYYVIGVLTCSVILVRYLGYNKRLRIFDKPDYFGPEWQDIEKESEVKAVQLIKPLYFGADKGAIIKTICVDGYHNLSDILEHSGLEEREFWDTFYELLSEGELESTENSLYVVRNDIKKQWLASR